VVAVPGMCKCSERQNFWRMDGNFWPWLYCYGSRIWIENLIKFFYSSNTHLIFFEGSPGSGSRRISCI
jgi:hypothetical protein